MKTMKNKLVNKFLKTGLLKYPPPFVTASKDIALLVPSMHTLIYKDVEVCLSNICTTAHIH